MPAKPNTQPNAQPTIHKPTNEAAADPIKYAELPEVSELGPRLMKQAAELLAELGVVIERQKADEELEKELKVKLEKMQNEAELPGLRHMQWCFVARQAAGRRTLDKMLLIENGVDPEVIEQSMKTGEPYVTRTFKDLSRGR